MAYIAIENAPSYKIVDIKGTQAEVNAYAAANSGVTAIIGDKNTGHADASGNYYWYGVGQSPEQVHNAPPATTAGTRAERRSQIYAELRVRAREPVPIFAKDQEDLNMLHALTVKLYACALNDANMDSETAFGHILTTAKYGYGDHLKTWAGAGSQRTNWRRYLLAEEPAHEDYGRFATPDGSGQPVYQSSVTVPAAWQNQKPEAILYE